MDYNFYNVIKKPDYAPDKKVFRPVWSFLYMLMALSFLFLYFEPMSIAKFFAIPLFFLQLILNVMWTPVFFKYKKMGWAFVICLLLLITVILMTNLFFKISFLLGILQIPYIIWLTFALILNYHIIRLNP